MVVNVRANDILKMREDATDESPVIDTIPPNVRGDLSGRNSGTVDLCSIRPSQGLGEPSFRRAPRQSRRTYPVNTSEIDWVLY
jgi:hypothetical protein